jgi:hypothetical protein
MAESDTILQLGIDAAREGNREEARNLFGLLTRQEPDNLQAWLWLAGVADGPEDRRAALERVLELDPTNEMAIKGLQTMGAEPAARAASEARATTVAASAAATAAGAAAAREMSDEERFAAELDMAFDDYDALPKTEAPPRPEPDLELEAGAAAASARAETTRRAASRATSRRGATTPVRSGDDDDWRASMARRDSGGLRRILLLAAAIAGLLLVLILLLRPFDRPGSTASNSGGGDAGTPTAQTDYPGPGAGVAGGGDATATPELTSTPEFTSTPELTPTAEVAPGGQQPGQPPGQPPSGDLSAANPQPAGIGTLLESNGWNYTYPSETYAAALGSQVGPSTASGNWVLVLVHVANNSGRDQPLPPDFFVLKDAQGRIYRPQPQVSSAYVIRGVNADVSMEDTVPANGLITSIPLLFDVTPGATNLVLFAGGNTGQGWQVLESVP